MKWARLSCHDFVDNQIRLQLFVLAHNLGNFLRRLALPRSVKHWSLTTLREKLIKIGAKVVTHARYVVFQMAEVAVPKRLFRAIRDRIRRLRLPEAVPRLRPYMKEQTVGGSGGDGADLREFTANGCLLADLPRNTTRNQATPPAPSRQCACRPRHRR